VQDGNYHARWARNDEKLDVIAMNEVKKHIRIFKGKKIFCNMKLVLQEERKQTEGEAGL